MTLEEKKRIAAQRKAEGYSLAQIGDELGASKTTVRRWLTEQDGTGAFHGTENDPFDGTEDEPDFESEYEPYQDDEGDNDPDDETADTPLPARANRKPVPFHNRPRRNNLSGQPVITDPGLGVLQAFGTLEQMRIKEKLESERNQLERKRLKIEESKAKAELAKAEAEKLRAAAEKEQRQQERLERASNLERKKTKLLKRYRNVVAYFVDHANGYRWLVGEVLALLEQVEDVSEDIRNLAEKQGLDPDGLYLPSVLDDLWELVQGAYENHQNKFLSSGSILFKFDDDEIEEFEESLEIEDLFDPLEEDDEDEDEDDDENEDEDDDDENDD